MGDSQANTEEPDTSQFERFAELAKHLLTIPKRELSAKLTQENDSASKRKSAVPDKPKR